MRFLSIALLSFTSEFANASTVDGQTDAPIALPVEETTTPVTPVTADANPSDAGNEATTDTRDSSDVATGAESSQALPEVHADIPIPQPEETVPIENAEYDDAGNQALSNAFVQKIGASVLIAFAASV